MSILTLLWVAWAAATASLLVLLGYRGTLTRYEGDQIFLDESMHNLEAEQADIVRRVNRIEPLVRAATGLTCLISAVLLGTYVWAAVRQFTM